MIEAEINPCERKFFDHMNFCEHVDGDMDKCMQSKVVEMELCEAEKDFLPIKKAPCKKLYDTGRL